MNKSQLQPGMTVAVKANRYNAVKAVVLEVGGWVRSFYGGIHKDSHRPGHTVAVLTEDGRCLPDVVQCRAETAWYLSLRPLRH